jgi:hypothetical protein
MARCSITLGILLFVGLAWSESAFAQIQFEADYLFLRQSGRDSTSFINGPDGLSSGKTDFGFQSGYRFGISGGGTWWEVEAVFAQVDGWDSTANTVMTRPLVFDDATNGFVAPANTIAIPNSLLQAATNPNAGGINEMQEIEHLQAGGFAQLKASSRYRDFELNFASNRNRSWYRFGIGYRNLQLNEGAGFLARGTFDAIDSATGDTFGNPGNVSNDGLSDAALQQAGLSLVSGTADGFNAAAVPNLGPDTVTLLYHGSAANELNGIQALFAARLIPTDLFLLEGIFKAGVYHNSVRSNVSELIAGSVNDDSVYGRNFSDRKGTASFVGTVGLRGLIPLTDYISLVSGYEALFLTGVALGTDQFQGVHTNALGARTYSAKANDSTILHGGNVGLQVSW